MMLFLIILLKIEKNTVKVFLIFKFLIDSC